MTFEYADPSHAPPPGDPDDSDWLMSVAHFIWQVVVGVGVPIGVGVAIGVASSPLPGGLFGMLTAVLIFTTARASQLARRRRGLIVLSHVDTAVRMNLALPSTLRRFRDAESRKVAKLLDRVAKNLEGGAWVSDAMIRARVDLSARVLDRLAAAERAGRLSASISEIFEHERGLRSRGSSRGPFLRVYAIILLMLIPSVAWLLSIFVMPKYQQIMKDFRLAMPMFTQFLIAMTQTIAPIMAALGALLFVLASQVAINEMSSATPRRWTNMFRSLLDHVRWFTPILGRLDRDRGLADVCLTVAEGLDAQRPLNAAVAEARQPHLNVVLRSRVKQWADALEQGLSPGEAAAAATFPEMMSGMLGRERDVPDIASTLHFLERYYRSRFSRLQLLLRESGVPLLALAGGVCVVVVALAVFMPMISIVEHVSVPIMRP